MRNIIYTTKIEAYSRSGEEGIILTSEVPVLFQLNQLSCEIWELIDGENTVQDIIDQVSIRYPQTNDEEIASDVLELFAALLENDLIKMLEEK